MKTVNIGELKDHLSAYLRHVRAGEEVVICDRNRAIARILPMEDEDLSDRERALVAAGILRLPKVKIEDRKKFLEEFFAMPAPQVNSERIIQNLIEEREDRV